jgi:alpha-L-rhamnosidase
MKIVNLRTERVVAPVGVDFKQPVFSWEIADNGKDVFQESYRILVALDSEFENLVWDSGIVESNATFSIKYEGEELTPDTKYFIHVIAVVNGKEIKSEVSTFITGLFGAEIEGQWVTPQKDEYHPCETAPYIRKTFDVKDFEYATLHIYSYGWYKLFLGGEEFGDRMFAPGQSPYETALYYDAYDITEVLKKGKNVFGMIMGDGYNMNANPYLSQWTGSKRFIACINIHKKNGQIEKIPSDTSWKYEINTPIVTHNIYNGEVYDATKEIKGWNTLKFDDSAWKNVYPYNGKKENLDMICELGPYVQIVEYKKPKKIIACNTGRYILDFGQNTAGFVKFSLKGEKGTRVCFRYSEELSYSKKNGYRLDLTTNRAAYATDTYIFKGEGVETHEPSFTYHGYRYVEVTGLSEKPSKDDIVACVVNTAFPACSEFATDNETLNQIFSNAKWSIRVNSYTYPTDCPVRDERTPCPMDLFGYINTAVYMNDSNAYYYRYFHYMRKQLENFFIVREENDFFNLNWDGCLYTVPWYLNKFYGDKASIERHYEILKKGLDFYWEHNKNFTPKGLFGDWCAPNVPGNYATSFRCPDETELHFMIFVFKMVSGYAEYLGYEEDAKKYAEISKNAAKAYNKRFFNNFKGTYSNGAQAPTIYAIMNGIIPESKKKKVEKKFIDAIVKGGNHLDVGIMGNRDFLTALCDIGALDTAIDCFINPEFPSYKYEIDQGATTLWEQWYIKGDMASHSHAMFAGGVSGFFTRLAGVTPIEDGFRTIQIKPCLTKHINTLKSSITTVCGKVDVAYEKNGKDFKLKAKIPANCKAVIIMPNGEKHSVGNGKFEFTAKI